MTDVLKKAAQSTTSIIEDALHATMLLQGLDLGIDTRSRVNSIGVLNDPRGYRAALIGAREMIDRAINTHDQTAWPNESDYHAV